MLAGMANLCRSSDELSAAPRRDLFSRDGRAGRLAAEVRRLRRLAETDALTELPNRRWWGTFRRRMARANRRDGQPAVIFVDVDDMKRINDAQGHLEGDRRIVRIARALARTVGKGRSVVRFGGDEFIVPLPVANVRAARQLAAALLDAVRREARMTASAGIGLVRESAGRSRQDLDLLLSVADRALRRAKAAGGDCVRWSWA